MALFVALGGTSYAAIKLPANSVGNRQVKSNAITSGKIRNGTLRAQDFSAGTVRRGIRGPAGPAGSPADGLPSGKTLRGRFEAGDGSPPNNVDDVASEAISFGAQLAAAPPRTIVLNPPGPPQCPGTVADPRAAPATCASTSAIASRSARSTRSSTAGPPGSAARRARAQGST